MLYGYTNALSYKSGDRLQVMADTDRDRSVDVSFVSLRRQDRKTIEEAIPWASVGKVQIEPQNHCIGSFVAIEGLAGEIPKTFSIGAWIWPTLLDQVDRLQGIIGNVDADGGGFVLGVRGADVVLKGVTASGKSFEARLAAAVRSHKWALVEALSDGSGVQLRCTLVGSDPVTASSPATAMDPTSRGTFVIGAGGAVRVDRITPHVRGIPVLPFNGKIERPFMRRGSEFLAVASGDPKSAVAAGDLRLVACWDFAPRSGHYQNEVPDLAGSHGGVHVNLPTSGITGVTWSGEVMRFQDCPDEYAALHFSEDDLVDVGWHVVAESTVPDGLPSGIYGVKLAGDGEEDIVPIVVVPSRPAGRTLVVMPTFTYLAYANEHMFSETWDAFVLTGRHDLSPGKRDLDRVDAPQYGRSLYDRHRDESGVKFSSSQRAILNHRIDYAMAWLLGEGSAGLGGDMYLIEWLQKKGFDFDVVTDLEVHREPNILSSYKAVLTGAHPEYTSASLLRAYESYRDSGGKLMYLGANGFYWVTGVLSEEPLVVEIRRGHAGIRTWMSEPGETTLVSTGEPGGLWRFRGHAPQRLVGTGFAAQGQSMGRPYTRSAKSYDPEFQWVFEGVEGDEFGKFGLVCGAAGGHEVDRADVRLGTPHDAVILASATGFDDYYQRVIEELNQTLPVGHGGSVDPNVRADMVYFECAGGGAVFSVSSIAWSGSLLTEDDDAGPSRITENVLRRFIAS